MDAEPDLFDDPSPNYLSRIAVSTLALMALAAILAATLQISGAAYGATPAALSQGPAEAPRAAPVAKCGDVAACAVPRIVITARRDGAQSPPAPVAGSR